MSTTRKLGAPDTESSASDDTPAMRGPRARKDAPAMALAGDARAAACRARRSSAADALGHLSSGVTKALSRARTDIPRPSPARLQRFARELRAWFRANGRDLPWRRTRDPYRVLVSELMLQQTQVSRVVDHYARFLERFPTLEHVARARPERVMEAWEGLGYYARARNLHRLAREVTSDARSGAGGLPSAPDVLRRLPGIGPYTAGAVASFAYERRAALVDTNVARVLRRAFVPTIDPRTARGVRIIWQLADWLLPRTGQLCWTHNQAIMELGALVCTARRAHCAACPVRRDCSTGQRSLTSG